MSESQDTEITLGIGKLLGIFFVLVVLCGVFLGIGYSLGRNTAKQSGSLVGDNPAAATTTAQGGSKPVAGQATPAKPADCPAGQDCTTAATNGSPNGQPQDLTFYKAVEQKDPDAQLAPAEGASPQRGDRTTQPELRPASVSNVAPAAGFMVQVAAVSKREDAELLRGALQSKQYPVVITNVPTDRLFHVQVGPFSDMKDAETIKTRLVSDGYNPILKH